MATKATIYKASLNIADMDSHYYAEHNLTLAKHPSESDLRMMVRLLAFTLNPDETLLFGGGISTDDEPDLWKKSLSGEIELWIDLGQVDEKRIKKACGKADKVVIYTYQQRNAEEWWKQAGKNLQRYKNLTVIALKFEGDIEALAQRTMHLQCNISDGELVLLDKTHSVAVHQQIFTMNM